MNRIDSLMLVAAGLLAAGVLATAQADHGCGCGQGCASCQQGCGHHGCGHGGGCCDRCGCHCPVRKVCRLVCEMKEVKVDCWGCKCVDFCIPHPSNKCRTCCECVCGDCSVVHKPSSQGGCCGAGCGCWEKIWALPKKFVYCLWQPCGACVHTKKVLMHRVEIKRIPVYRWEVEYLCPRCESCCGPAELPPNLDLVPEPPCRNAPLKYEIPGHPHTPPVPGPPPVPRHPMEDKAPTPPPLKLNSNRPFGPLSRLSGG